MMELIYIGKSKNMTYGKKYNVSLDTVIMEFYDVTDDIGDYSIKPHYDFITIEDFRDKKIDYLFNSF
jgi:hypothetical protein